ncbi:MAG: glutamate--tRNA ligase, partial [Anaerolineales bacterium]
TLDDAVQMAGFFFKEELEINPQELIGKNMDIAESCYALEKAYQILQPLEQINAETAEAKLRALADELNIKAGQLFGILRIAVTGQSVSPPLFECMDIIGKETVLKRIEQALGYLRNIG